MKESKLASILGIVILLALFGSVGEYSVAAAQPGRSISLSTTYMNIVIGKGEEVKLEVEVTNGGEVDEDIDLLVASPEGWGASFRELNGGFDVRSLHIFPGESETVSFHTKPLSDVAEGDYEFVLRAASRDRQVESSLELTVGVEEKVPILGGVELAARYPVLAGPSGIPFAFSIDIKNERDEDRLFELSATPLPGWDISFRPAFEREKQISSLRVMAGGTERIEVGLTPRLELPPQVYSVIVEATSGEISGAVELKAVVTGTYYLLLQTASGRLNATARAGEDNYLSLLVVNRGSAAVEGISFLPEMPPEGWRVRFEPEEFDRLHPGTIREVTAIIRPPGKAIAGDYALTLRAIGQQASDMVDLRVTVATPTTWGWLGIGIVLLVIAALAGVFWRLGRR